MAEVTTKLQQEQAQFSIAALRAIFCEGAPPLEQVEIIPGSLKDYQAEKEIILETKQTMATLVDTVANIKSAI